MIIKITGKDTGDRSWIKDESLHEIMRDLCLDFMRIKVTEVEIIREDGDEKPS